jgi:hypothetical protein
MRESGAKELANEDPHRKRKGLQIRQPLLTTRAFSHDFPD